MILKETQRSLKETPKQNQLFSKYNEVPLNEVSLNTKFHLTRSSTYQRNSPCAITLTRSQQQQEAAAFFPGETKHMTNPEREMGAIVQEIKELRHDLKNLNMIVNESGISLTTKADIHKFREIIAEINYRIQDMSEIKQNLAEVSEEMTKIKIRLYSAISAIGIITGVVGWLIGMLIEISSVLSSS